MFNKCAVYLFALNPQVIFLILETRLQSRYKMFFEIHITITSKSIES